MTKDRDEETARLIRVGKNMYGDNVAFTPDVIEIIRAKYHERCESEGEKVHDVSRTA